tara:strand:- start:1083 stop:1679 length:597 start_codon:yes stop_codon:yes gene_type:complete
MFDIGFSELLLFGVIALIVLGPEKLPQAARTAGQWYAKIRRTVSTLQSEIEAELDLAETRQQMQKELAKIRQTEAEMRREMAEMRGNMKEFESSQSHSIKATHTTVTNREHAEVSPEPEHDLNDDGVGAANRSNTLPVAQPMITRPWENMWFRLGAYDKARRLPMPPYLPNYKADTLLNAHLDKPLKPQASVNQQETK